MVKPSFGQFLSGIFSSCAIAALLKIEGKIAEEIKHKILPKRYIYSDAKSACIKQGSFLPSLESNLTEVLSVMRSNRISSVWMAVRRMEMDGWHWTDNAAASPDDDTFWKETGGHCGVIDIPNDKFMADSCSAAHSRTGFICNLTGPGEDCGNYVACMKMGGFRLAFGSGSVSWFVARRRCLMSGGDLAKIDTQEKRKNIRDELDRTQLTSTIILHCQKYYIGIRKDKWVSINSGVEKDITGLNVPWLDDEPSRFHCAELVAYEDKVVLKTKDCVDENKALCLRHIDIEEVPAPTEEEPEECPEEKEQIKNLQAGFGVTLPLAVCILGAIILFLVWKFYRRPKDKTLFTPMKRNRRNRTIKLQDPGARESLTSK